MVISLGTSRVYESKRVMLYSIVIIRPFTGDATYKFYLFVMNVARTNSE